MKKIIFTGLILLSSAYLSAQIKAVTETGDELFLYQDGTWEYANDNQVDGMKIPVSEQEYMKNESSTFLVKSKVLDVGIWINPKIWSFSKGTGEEAFEFQFQKKQGDLYAMLIAEKIEIPVETLRGIALDNAKAVAPDIKITNEEYRTVNGIQVFMLQMEGTIQGMKVKYHGYYYSNSSGTIQLLTYTGLNLYDEYLETINLFLNGFVVL